MTHKEETKLVKDALARAGITAKVGHGHGTAYSWLEINVGSAEQFGPHIEDEKTRSHYACEPCKRIRAIAKQAENIAREATGRTGEYGGHILVFTQKAWDNKLKQTVEIVQPA